MSEKSKYFVVTQKAVPEVLLKVVEAKRLLDSSKAITVQEATDRVGISRSSFYKYKDDIFPFHDNSKGKSITFVLQMDDEPGLLSLVLKTIADYKGNVLTIHQTIPINRRGLPDPDGGYSADHGGCIVHDRSDREPARHPLSEDLSK